MNSQWGVGVPDSAIIMLAQVMLKRMRLTGVRADTRQAAIAVIKGMRTVSKATPLIDVIPSAIGKAPRVTNLCSSCGKPLQIGQLCRTLWTMYDGEHIQCEGKPR